MPRPQQTAAPLVPAHATLPKLREAAAHCKACDLWKRATQTVFGEGASRAEVMFIGEQPGDREDLMGHPFVGPAGRVLDKALEAAGIDRGRVFVTNAVKHFKWEPRGKRRIHKKPNHIEITACRPWLDAEISVVRPQVIVCLGATAAQALLGRDFKVSTERGRPVPSSLAPTVIASVHPSSILRAQDDESRHREMQRFIDDMKVVAQSLRKPKAA
jgi:uracil-DNA glycosylase family protein